MNDAKYSVAELKRMARMFAGGVIQNLEFPHEGFDDVPAEQWDVVMKEFEKISDKLFKSGM